MSKKLNSNKKPWPPVEPDAAEKPEKAEKTPAKPEKKMKKTPAKPVEKTVAKPVKKAAQAQDSEVSSLMALGGWFMAVFTLVMFLVYVLLGVSK